MGAWVNLPPAESGKQGSQWARAVAGVCVPKGPRAGHLTYSAVVGVMGHSEVTRGRILTNDTGSGFPPALHLGGGC